MTLVIILQVLQYSTNNKTWKKTRFQKDKNRKVWMHFKKELLKQDWSIIYREKDTNMTYDGFLRIFMIKIAR